MTMLSNEQLVEEQLELAVEMEVMPKAVVDRIRGGSATDEDLSMASELLLYFDGFAEAWRFCLREELSRGRKRLNKLRAWLDAEEAV
jgi:hypothetical protein